MFQDGALFSSLTVRENVEVPLKSVPGLDPGIARSLAELKIAMVGLPAIAGDKYPSELSGGMRKRAGLARALALDPEIVFLDEPTAGLDPIGAAEFDTLIQNLSRSLGLTVFLVTHDLDTLHAICDRIAVLAERRVWSPERCRTCCRSIIPGSGRIFTGQGRARRWRRPETTGTEGTLTEWKPRPTTF
jgi:phospholipid/cholesterol/gamma-HCH transport system ATP-binding protein